jgi:hypothetical protein
MSISRSATAILLTTFFTLLLNISGDGVALSANHFPFPNAQSVEFSAVEVTLSAPYTTISWDERDAAQEKFQLPLLYLHRQREAAPAADRTLEISVAGLPPGFQIQVETVSLHVNPSTGQRHTLTKGFVTPDRPCTFDHSCILHWTLDASAMLSDFYYLRLTDRAGQNLGVNPNPGRPAFVVLDTWDVALGSEKRPAYIVRTYYATLFPFASGPNDLENRLSPDEVTDFIADQLVPIIQDTWHTQVEQWGFGTPLHSRWDADKVVEMIITDPPYALMDGTGTYTAYIDPSGRPLPERRVWWRASCDAFQRYDTLENAYKSVFAHEFFHLMQWSVLLSTGQPTNLWLNVFVEAQAEFAESAQYPDLEMSKAHVATRHSAYVGSANRFLAHRLNTSYRDLQADQKDKYDAALYWRFLYEQYNDMGIVRAALEEMARRYNPNIVASIASTMDAAFARLDGPFHTYEESLVAFAVANYALRLENGRCAAAEFAACKGLYYDPDQVYADPLLEAQLIFDGLQLKEPSHGANDGAYYGLDTASTNSVPLPDPGDEPLTYHSTIPSSYGMDFIEIRLDPAVQGQSLMVEFQAEGKIARFNVQLWQLSPGEIKPRAITLQPETLTQSAVYQLPSTVDRLALVITRLDADETADPVGAYQVTLDSSAVTADASSNK